MSAEVACIVLAAGLSRRFGSPKLLHPLDDGRPLLAHTLECYSQVFEQIYVVIGAQENRANSELRALLGDINSETKFQAIETTHNIDGMSQSIVAGVSAASEAHGWLIGLGDMPYVLPDTASQITTALRPDNIVMPRYQGQPGNPVAFGKEFYSQLLALMGDKGARSVTKRAAHKVVYIDVDDAGVLQDVDHPNDIL